MPVSRNFHPGAMCFIDKGHPHWAVVDTGGVIITNSKTTVNVMLFSDKEAATVVSAYLAGGAKLADAPSDVKAAHASSEDTLVRHVRGAMALTTPGAWESCARRAPNSRYHPPLATCSRQPSLGAAVSRSLPSARDAAPSCASAMLREHASMPSTTATPGCSCAISAAGTRSGDQHAPTAVAHP